MILVDTSIWVDHLRGTDPALQRLLTRSEVLAHPCVVGELALGGVSRDVLALMARLPAAVVATAEETLVFISENGLVGEGIGYVDAQLLAAVRLTPGATLWTRDSRLRRSAERLGHAAHPH